MLEVTNVTKSVNLENGDALTILNPLSFKIAKGDSVSIVGPSGSGKSTLLALAAGLDTPTAGDITIGKTLISAASDAERAEFRSKQLGIVFQSFHLFSHLSAFENVRIAALIAGTERAEAETKSKQWLDAVGLQERIHHHPSQLSGGEKQRVAIARALVNEPDILLCDEPTGNLDTQNAEKVFGMLLDLCEQKNTTLLFVTHDDNLAKKTSRTLTLEGGRLVSDSLNPN